MEVVGGAVVGGIGGATIKKGGKKKYSVQGVGGGGW